MKLVDILARELKEWPENCSGYDYCVQMHRSREVVFGGINNNVLVSEIAEDNEDAKVTRAEWQAAVDALDIPKFPSDKIEWNGEGLPPVGTACEFAGGTHCPDDPFDKDLKEGDQVTIIAHFKCGDFTLAAFTFDPKNPDRGMFQVEQGSYGCFRPIRTPEQIAADERLHKLRNAHTAIARTLDSFMGDILAESVSRQTIEAMIDAGYVKGE